MARKSFREVSDTIDKAYVKLSVMVNDSDVRECTTTVERASLEAALMLIQSVGHAANLRARERGE